MYLNVLIILPYWCVLAEKSAPNISQHSVRHKLISVNKWMNKSFTGWYLKVHLSSNDQYFSFYQYLTFMNLISLTHKTRKIPTVFGILVFIKDSFKGAHEVICANVLWKKQSAPLVKWKGKVRMLTVIGMYLRNDVSCVNSKANLLANSRKWGRKKNFRQTHTSIYQDTQTIF